MPDGSNLKSTFTLDGKQVEASPGRDDLAGRAATGHEDPAPLPRAGARLPARRQLPGLHGRDRRRERVLAASCMSGKPAAGHEVVRTASETATSARHMVMELLVADQPARETAHDPQSKFWAWADAMGIANSRFPARKRRPSGDSSHVAIAVNLDACIHCNLCVRACREVQVNDVIGMAHRGRRGEDRVRLRRPDGSVDLRGLR